MRIPTGGNAPSRELSSGERAFDPEATHAMSVAFDGARWVLGGLANPTSARVAELIIELASAGERDPWRLRAGVLRSLE